MTRVKTITNFLTYCPIVIHCVSMEFKLHESSHAIDKFTQKFENLRVDYCVGSHRPYGCSYKRDTNIASPYQAIIFERNMSWMSCIWINWFALLFVKVWWSKHSKLVTLIWDSSDILCPLWIGFCELASQKPKKSHLERRSTAVWCNAGAAPGHPNLRWWGLYMKFRD